MHGASVVLETVGSKTTCMKVKCVPCRVDGDQPQLMFFPRGQRDICQPLKRQTSTDSERRTSKNFSPSERSCNQITFSGQRMSAELLFIYLLFLFVSCKFDVAVLLFFVLFCFFLCMKLYSFHHVCLLYICFQELLDIKRCM